MVCFPYAFPAQICSNKEGITVKKKCCHLAVWSFGLALAIFVFSYILYHHLGPEGFTAIRRSEPYKPMITWLFAIWGTQFLFAGVMSLLVGKIFFKGK